MPSVITAGSRVWANIGPLQEATSLRTDPSILLPRKKKARRTRVRLHGTVIQSCGSPPNNLWRVFWDECGKTSDHRPVTLHLDKGARMSQMSPEAVEQQLNRWLNMPEIYVGNHDQMMDWTANNYNIGTTLTNVTNSAATNITSTTAAPSQSNPPAPSQSNPAPSQSNVNPSTDAPAQPNIILAPAQPPPPSIIHVGTPPAAPNPHTITTPPGIVLQNRVADAVNYSDMPPLERPNLDNDDDSDDDDDDDGSLADDIPPVDAFEASETFDPNQAEREFRADSSTLDHVLRQCTYLREKRELINHEVVVDKPRGSRTTWTVITDVRERDLPTKIEKFKQPGQVMDFDFGVKNRTVQDKSGRYSRINFLSLLRHLWPGCDDEQLEKMNKQREIDNLQNKVSRRVRAVRKITKSELWRFFGMMLCSRLYGGENGEAMWNNMEIAEGMKAETVRFDPGQWMSRGRFREIKKYIPIMFTSDEKKLNEDPWYQIIKVVEDFNSNRKRTIATSNLRDTDETMSPYCPQTVKTGNLPHLSYVFRKPEPLGTEFKNCLDGTSKIMLCLYLCRNKNDKKGDDTYDNVTKLKTARVTLKLMEDSEKDHDLEDFGNLTNDNATQPTFLGDSWFTSVDMCVLAKKSMVLTTLAW